MHATTITTQHMIELKILRTHSPTAAVHGSYVAEIWGRILDDDKPLTEALTLVKNYAEQLIKVGDGFAFVLFPEQLVIKKCVKKASDEASDVKLGFTLVDAGFPLRASASHVKILKNLRDAKVPMKRIFWAFNRLFEDEIVHPETKAKCQARALLLTLVGYTKAYVDSVAQPNPALALLEYKGLVLEWVEIVRAVGQYTAERSEFQRSGARLRKKVDDVYFPKAAELRLPVDAVKSRINDAKEALE